MEPLELYQQQDNNRVWNIDSVERVFIIILKESEEEANPKVHQIK